MIQPFTSPVEAFSLAERAAEAQPGRPAQHAENIKLWHNPWSECSPLPMTASSSAGGYAAGP